MNPSGAIGEPTRLLFIEGAQGTINNGQTVTLPATFEGDGFATNRYRYIGAQPTKVFSFDNEDYNSRLEWKDLGDPVLDDTHEVLTQLAAILGDDAGLIDSYARADVKGQKNALAAAIMDFNLVHEADAIIRSGAQINQNIGRKVTADCYHLVG